MILGISSKIENKLFIVLQIRNCSGSGGTGIIVSAIAAPDISLKVVPVALRTMLSVRSLRQKYINKLIDVS